jgi:hypothetical protein
MAVTKESNQNPHWKNPSWRYYPACDTDIRRTFEKFAPVESKAKPKKSK